MSTIQERAETQIKDIEYDTNPAWAIVEGYKRGFRDGLAESGSPKWVKASERRPSNNNLVHINYYTQNYATRFKTTGYYENGKFLSNPGGEPIAFQALIEWLDETPSPSVNDRIEKLEAIADLCKEAFIEATGIYKGVSVNDWWGEFKMRNNL